MSLRPCYLALVRLAEADDAEAGVSFRENQCMNALVHKPKRSIACLGVVVAVIDPDQRCLELECSGTFKPEATLFKISQAFDWIELNVYRFNVCTINMKCQQRPPLALHGFKPPSAP